MALLAGCSSGSSSDVSTKDTSSQTISPGKPRSSGVFAQGQILPSGGIVRIYSTPGDTVIELPVTVGTDVNSGDTLAIMRSVKAIEVQRKVLAQQKKATQREQATAIRQAELRLSAAELKVRQANAQRTALEKRAELLELGKKQLAATERMLRSLETISHDSLTHEFVGQLEVERQRIAVDESRLKLAEQQTNYEQTEIELELASEAASHEVEAAQAMLAMAKEADAVSVIDERLKALESEAAQSVIVAPSNGVVLALGAPVGGSAVQTPLVELADLSKIVCEAEVNVAYAGQVSKGQRAIISSPAFGTDVQLTGRVREKNRLVGRPQLRSPDPLAASDYRTVPVIIDLDDPKAASQWLQLQVEVVIKLDDAKPL